VQTVYFETVGDRHLQKVGGLTVLERRIREVARRGATHVLVAAERVDFGRPLPVVLEFVSRTSTVPEGVVLERADVIDGMEIADAAAAGRVELAIVRGLNHGDEGIVDMRVRRPLAMRLTRVIARASLALRPAHVMIVAALMGLAAAAIVVMRGDVWGVAIGGVALEASAIVEGTVLRLARLRFQSVRYEGVARAIVDSAFVLAIGFVSGGMWWWMALGAAAVMPWRVPRPGRLRALGQRDAFVFFAMISCVIGVPQWVVIDGLVMSGVNIIALVVRRRA
jgi:hypothetical protein